MANLTTLASGLSVVLTVTEQQSIVLNNGRTDVARLQITTGPGAGSVVTASHNGRRVYGPFGAGTITLSAVSGDVRYELSGDSVSPLKDDSGLLAEDGSILALSEATPYVNATASAGATVFTGACELAGWYCSVAAGNITIYDALSATGTPIVPATALAVGPMPIFGAGTNGKLALATGCHVVLSGAATVRVLVA